MSDRPLPARWPVLMSEADAAEYVGVSVSQFRREVERGLWPGPKARGARINTYDRRELDDAVDRIDNPTDHADLDREFGLGHDQNPLPRNAKAR